MVNRLFKVCHLGGEQPYELLRITYLGVQINKQAKVLLDDDTETDNIYAAGEIMAGNILGKGYLAGIGMTIGTVFGRIAGEEAARHAGK